MAAVPLANLLSLFLEGLASQHERASPEAGVRLLVEDVELRVPAYLQVFMDGTATLPESSRRLLLTLPDVRETPAPRSLGRLRITLVAQSPEASLAEEESES